MGGGEGGREREEGMKEWEIIIVGLTEGKVLR